MRIGNVAFVTPDPSLLNRLAPVAREVFVDTFAHLYEAAAFDRFCDETYRPGGTLSRDFEAAGVRWRVAVAAGEPIGYAKLTPLRVPAVDPDSSALELQQLYVLRDWHGAGVAAGLMEWALETARADGVREVYLTVFDHNERAKRFYARYGFEEVGRCTFQLGDRIDDDRIWRVRLSPPDL